MYDSFRMAHFDSVLIVICILINQLIIIILGLWQCIFQVVRREQTWSSGAL